jgi:RNA polymerase sigma factor (sigma-70 family)
MPPKNSDDYNWILVPSLKRFREAAIIAFNRDKHLTNEERGDLISGGMLEMSRGFDENRSLWAWLKKNYGNRAKSLIAKKRRYAELIAKLRQDPDRIWTTRGSDEEVELEEQVERVRDIIARASAQNKLIFKTIYEEEKSIAELARRLTTLLNREVTPKEAMGFLSRFLKWIREQLGGKE